MERVKKGQIFIVIKDFPTHAMTSWGKPYSGSEGCVIPKGTIMIAPYDQIEEVLAFGVIPDQYKEMEPLFISKQTLGDKDYDGYHFSFYNEDYGRYFIYLDESKNDPSQYAISEKTPTKHTLILVAGKKMKMIKNPTISDIENMISLFDTKGDSKSLVPGYVTIRQANILNNIKVYSKENSFCLEYQEGSKHHKSNGFFNTKEIIKILTSYVDGKNIGTH